MVMGICKEIEEATSGSAALLSLVNDKVEVFRRGNAMTNVR